MYNYRQHDISEATAKRLEEAEKFIDTRLTMAKLAINDGDFQDADLLRKHIPVGTKCSALHKGGTFFRDLTLSI